MSARERWEAKDSAASEAMAGAPLICESSHYKRCVVWFGCPGSVGTFIDLIASCACSMVSISMNAVVCGSLSWSTISILSPVMRIDVSPDILLGCEDVRKRTRVEAGRGRSKSGRECTEEASPGKCDLRSCRSEPLVIGHVVRDSFATRDKCRAF